MGSSVTSINSVKSLKQNFNKLCGAAQFYLAMSVVGLFMYIVNMLEHADKLKSTLSIVIHTIVALIWTCILNWICKMKYGKKKLNRFLISTQSTKYLEELNSVL